MEQIGKYLLEVSSAALLCGTVTGYLGKKGMLGSVIKLICGIFMLLVVISPWTDIRLTGIGSIAEDIGIQASAAAYDGEKNAHDAMCAIITERVEAYILDKAASMDTELQVAVLLTEDSPPAPCAVRLSGKISPYNKALLSQMIEKELGIGMEAQEWTG